MSFWTHIPYILRKIREVRSILGPVWGKIDLTFFPGFRLWNLLIISFNPNASSCLLLLWLVSNVFGKGVARVATTLLRIQNRELTQNHVLYYDHDNFWNTFNALTWSGCVRPSVLYFSTLLLKITINVWLWKTVFSI